ncbi:13267_t:CDS:2, partial [Entrophospora sp. SA101]
SLNIPYIPNFNNNYKNLGNDKKYYVEVYGCQMNVNDTEILMSIMDSAGYQKTSILLEADIIFLVTCAIRDKAENKIWHRLKYLKSFKTKENLKPLIGVLGCMAERLKSKLLDADKLVDVVCGPDAYRSLPHLLSLSSQTSQGIANVMLSADETYADITPVRLHNDSISATLRIERSRPLFPSIIEEVKLLSNQGIKEVLLLGQNVNSYRDTSQYESYQSIGIGNELSNKGFSTIYRRKEGGIRFTELLDNVSIVDPEMRIRFTSPHPKDFPIELLKLIAERPNICKQIHLPVQSGNTQVLKRMRRGYSREATDIITGFCGETEEEHKDTLSLMEIVKYDMAYMFAYSMREKTHAHRNYVDDVPKDVKQRRLSEIIKVFHQSAKIKLSKLIDQPQIVLVEGHSKRNHQHSKRRLLKGRTDGGHKIYFDDISIPDPNNININGDGSNGGNCNVTLKNGDYVVVIPKSNTSSSLFGIPIVKASIGQFDSLVKSDGFNITGDSLTIKSNCKSMAEI